MKEIIVLIGAGSISFTRGLIFDIIERKVDWEVRLVDIDEVALNTAFAFSKKLIKREGAEISVKAFLDRKEALKGASIVICTIGVGGRRAWETDVFISRKYGVYQSVGDTIMSGGSSRALRMIPVMTDVARDVLDIAPNALFFNYGNPMSCVCRGIRKATGADVIGLCHGVKHTLEYIASKINVSPHLLKANYVGINHLTFVREVFVDGKDVFPDILAKADNICKTFKDKIPNEDENLFSWQICKYLKAFPCVLDRHVIEFFPEFFRKKESYFGKTQGVDCFSFEDTIKYGDLEFEELKAVASNDEPLSDEYYSKISGEHEEVVNIIYSIRENKGNIFAANLPNNGQFSNLPYDSILEMPCVADSFSIRQINQSDNLPPQLAGILNRKFEWVELITEAALSGDFDTFVQALIVDGSFDNMNDLVAFAKEIINVQKEYLSDFNVIL